VYFLRVRRLKEQLAREGLSEMNRFGYLMAWMLMIALMSASDNSPGVVGILLVITVAGVIWAWRRNGGRNGTGILDRYLSIGFVVNLRVMVVLYAVLGLVAVLPSVQETLNGFSALFDFSGGGEIDESGTRGWMEPVLLAAEVWVAWSIGRHIGQVRAVAEAATVGVSRERETPAAPTRSMERLDRVVEHVMRSEIQASTPIQAGTAVTAQTVSRKTPAKRTGRVAAARRLKAWRRDHGRR
jgi:hypothetical protein